MLKCWFNFKSKSPESLQDMRNEYVFFNKYVTINSNLIHPKDLGLNECYLNLKIIDLLNQRNNLMLFVAICFLKPGIEMTDWEVFSCLFSNNE